MFALSPFYRARPAAQANSFTSLSDMMDSFFNDGFPALGSVSSQGFKMDVRENEQEYIIDSELPGFTKEQIKIELTEGRLIISAAKDEQSEQKEENYLHRESRSCSVRRGVYLGDIREEEITAKLENGVLQIVVPKDKKQEKRTEITIN